MSERLRTFDWSDHPLGPPETWPSALRSALGIALNSAFPVCIYWGSDLRLLYNDAWSTIPGPRHPACLGEPAQEVWADIWHIIEPQFTQAISTGEGVYFQDQMLPMQRFGVEEETYWTYNFTPIRVDDGSIGGIFNSGNETTRQVLQQKNTAFVLRLSDLFRAESDPIELRHQCLALLGEHLGVARVGLRERPAGGARNDLPVIDHWSAPGVDPVNERVGGAPLDPELWSKLLDGHVMCLDGTDPARREIESQVLDAVGCAAALAVPWTADRQTHAILFVHSMKDRHWTALDVEVVEAVLDRMMNLIDRARAAERERLMTNEINHRARNVLSVAQAIVRLSQPEDPVVMRGKLVDRIGALSKSHTLLADQRWEPVALRLIAEQELAPYMSGDDVDITLEGPDVLLTSVQCEAFALVLHELVTNAAKYGALQGPGGKLSVVWSTLPGDRLRLDWTETSPTPVDTEPTDQTGFGSRLLGLMIERQLKGSFERTLTPTGLHFVIEVPIEVKH